MAPSDDQIEKALVDAVYHIFKTDTDNLTVNSARQHAAATLELDVNFFKDSSDWKERSKDLIKDLAVCSPLRASSLPYVFCPPFVCFASYLVTGAF